MNRKGQLFLVFVVVLIIVGAGLMYGLMNDRVPPEVVREGDARAVSAQGFEVVVSDSGTGIATITALLRQEGSEREIFRRQYPRNTERRSEQISLGEAGLKQGMFEVLVRAADYPALPFFSANTTEKVFPFVFDSIGPEITVESRQHNFNQGGAGLIMYTVSETVSRSGVMVGERFFPGYKQSSGSYACLFACPHDMKAQDFAPRLVAEDMAGNITSAGFYYHINARKFARDRINISDTFLQRVMPQFGAEFPGGGTGIDMFLKVNRDLRKENVTALEELGRKTAPAPFWTRSFLRMAGSATEAKFAEARDYVYQGKVVDHQTHLGYDFASTSMAPVSASNRGRVVFAGRLGIYGKCVIIDHGLGLQTLYGHLSEIGVTEGLVVEQGQQIGRSGATGMAGGDHLHFEVNVSGVSVNPLEWLDPNWVKNNITSKLQVASGKKL